MTASAASSTEGAPSPTPIVAVLYSPYWRALVGVLKSVSGLSLLAILAVFFSTDAPVNPLHLMRLVTAVCLLPALVALLLRWAFVADAEIRADTLVLRQRHQRIEIPTGSVVAVDPWALPLPGSGLWLRLRSGARYREGLQIEDPAAFVRALTDAGAPHVLLEALRHPSMVYSQARYSTRRGTPYRLLLKFPVFALVPTLPLFRVHQLIAYGGAFGEYYQYGLSAYLLGFAVYWGTLTIYLMLYAAALRVPVELLSVVVVAVAPDRAVPARRILERLGAVLFYGGVPVLVVLRFLPW